MKNSLRMLVCGVILLAITAAVRSGELPQAKPADVKMSASGLEHADAMIRELIEQKKFAGAVTEVARDGKVVDLKAVGMMDVEKNLPMKTDTIFRIYSMTKPITTVAAMMLVEEGRLQLDDPVSKYIPEMKNLRVYVGPKDETAPAKREITVRDLMRHTAGFTYGAFGNSAVDKMYREKKLLDRNTAAAGVRCQTGRVAAAIPARHAVPLQRRGRRLGPRRRGGLGPDARCLF